MHIAHVIGAGVAVLALGWFAFTERATPGASQPVPPTPPEANGHYVLVVEGDRNALAIRHAVWKDAPWAGSPAGFTSKWQLQIHDADGVLLSSVPLDLSPFATGAHEVGAPPTVTGCVVRDSRIGMLVNAPAYPTAQRYRFVRDDGLAEPTELGAMASSEVRNLAGGGK